MAWHAGSLSLPPLNANTPPGHQALSLLHRILLHPSCPPQLAPREDSLIKAWKTVSEIDALLGTDFRPSMPTCAEEDGQGQGLARRESGSAASGVGLRLSRGSSHVDDSYVKVRVGAARQGAVRQGVTYGV